MKTIVLYNNRSNNGNGGGTARKVGEIWKDKDLVFVDVFSIGDYKEFFAKLEPDDEICICGGDGTLNYFVNDAAEAGYDYSHKIYVYPTGTGNDFLTDLGKTVEDAPVLVNEYLVNLPTVKVNGQKRLFVNGIGYGIDGYCCEEGDRQRAKDVGKEINYTSIAIKGLLFNYKPTNAEITVDGETHKFEKVWLAPTMNGRFYGGGMMATPDQDRLNPEHTVTTMVMFGKGKIGTLAAFPTIFKGEHVKKTNIVRTFVGKKVTVKFDRPTALQIDGETVLDVTEYTVETV